MTLSHEEIRRRGDYRDLSIDGFDHETLKKLYYFMLRLRRCELALIDEYHPADEMRCPIHFCVGQEAVPASLSLLLKHDDYLFTHHRSHGYYLAKGAPMNELFAELYGKASGANGGKAGSQDISHPQSRVYGGAILAGALGIAVGAGFGIQLKNTSQIAVTGSGEAATEEGIFWEAINFASVKKLPVVFVCENNRYSTHSPQENRQPPGNISSRVAAFGVRTETLFGNDVIKVYAALKKAVERARAGEGPTFVEAFTYRWNGHVGPENDDHIGYRTADEIEFWKRNCPIALLERQLFDQGVLSQADKEKMSAEIDEEIADAFAFAKASPFPEDADWRRLNLSPSTPLADRLLKDDASAQFDQNQQYAIPGPY
ncbi:MAG: acetoin dehydrogenase [Gemmatales bacterium]|nr:MAG: acetoin dehydrogenase [Gemmatales bacterium]